MCVTIFTLVNNVVLYLLYLLQYIKYLFRPIVLKKRAKHQRRDSGSRITGGWDETESQENPESQNGF